MPKRASDLRAWALIGAQKRLVEIADEAAMIHRAFPEIRNRREVPGRTRGRRPARTNDDNAAAKPVRRRRRLSAAGRAKLRASLKRRWAEAKKAGKTRLS